MVNNGLELCAIQMCSSTDIDENIADIERQLATLAPKSQQLVVLPECCLFFGGQEKAQLFLAQENDSSQFLVTKLAALAKQYNIFLVAGSIPVLAKTAGKYTNTSLVFSPQGKQLARYDKLHLFDVTVADSERNYCESRHVLAGEQVTNVDVLGINVGLSICYDLRFPELFRQLTQQGAKIITVPSAFTRVTGAAHWLTLLRARAIENQVYIIAPGQEGVHVNGRETWGHSVIISPWGEILAQRDTGKGIICAQYNEQTILEVRSAMPVASHNRFNNKLMSYE